LLITFALVLLGSMTAHTGQATVVIFMILLGTGIGMALPAALIALQNSIAQKDLGSGTSLTNFFRALGGSIGLAVLGAIFNAQLTNHLRNLAIDIGSGSSVDIAALTGLPAADRARVNDVFADAVTGVFHVVAPLAFVAMVITWFLKEIPLKTTVDAQPTAALFADG
jgi:MFS family permease